MHLIILILFAIICPLPTPDFEIKVRSTDIDVNGHVNNATVVEYLQEGRWDWLKHQGVTRDSLRKMNIVINVVNVNIDYRREILEGKIILVKTKPIKVGAKSIVFKQMIIDCMSNSYDEGTVTIVMVDSRTRKSCQIPNELRSIFEKQKD